MYVAHIIEAGADRLKAADKTKLRDDLSSKLREYRVDERHIPKIYWFFSRLYDCDDAELLNFNKRFLSDCSGRIHESIYGSERTFASSQNTSELTSSRLVRMIASIGEIVQCHPSLITEDLSELMQFIVASDVIREKVTQIVSRRQTPLPTQSQAGVANTNIHTVTEATNANRASSEAGPSQGTTTTQTSRPLSSQSTCHNTAGTTTTNAFVQSCFTNSDLFSSAVRARAVLTIGKMCLMDENLAKKCIPVFVKQLVKNQDHCVRNNIIVTVCDLCMRYTLLVDRYSSIIAMSLRDRSALVRKQALTLLTCLIKEQYIRWEGQIMYRFVSTLLDEDGGIREYAKMCLLDVLLVQFPKMFEHHFVECLFYFNRVRQGAWAIIKATDDEAECNQKNQCSLAGEKHREDRMKLYVFMLKTFNDESKFKLMERIGQEVFLAVTESSLDLSKTEVKYLLLDCYSVMCSGEIKLKHTLGSRGPNAAEDDEEEAPAAVQAGAKKVISQIFRKGIIEAVLPSVIQLRYYLQSKSEFCVYERGILLVLRSAFQMVLHFDLLNLEKNCRELCKDHKEQLDEFLASDPTLKEEMRYDLKKLEVLFLSILLFFDEKEKAEAEAQQRLLMSKARSARRSAAMRLSSTPLTATRHPRAANQQQPVTPLASRPTSTIETATQNTSERVASIIRNSLPAIRNREPLERVDEEEQPAADAAAAVTEEGSIQKGISDDEHVQPTATTDTADVQSSASEQPQTERQTVSDYLFNAGQTASTSTPVASVSADRSAARKKSSTLSEISPERIQRDSSAMNARAFSTPAHTMNEVGDQYTLSSLHLSLSFNCIILTYS
ncbi:unnamed protein product [Anisakis simplex]|uniref:Condensin-2 complex subunit D3 (inferred by orthology to a human protein) n=1 Tax=Anisakis simplex TaxID=6269 RepID=A0A0M3K3J8_ANISI|nr:unnamed protein product [Anisakis simplex]